MSDQLTIGAFVALTFAGQLYSSWTQYRPRLYDYAYRVAYIRTLLVTVVSISSVLEPTFIWLLTSRVVLPLSKKIWNSCVPTSWRPPRIVSDVYTFCSRQIYSIRMMYLIWVLHSPSLLSHLVHDVFFTIFYVLHRYWIGVLLSLLTFAAYMVCRIYCTLGFIRRMNDTLL